MPSLSRISDFAGRICLPNCPSRGSCEVEQNAQYTVHEHVQNSAVWRGVMGGKGRNEGRGQGTRSCVRFTRTARGDGRPPFLSVPLARLSSLITVTETGAHGPSRGKDRRGIAHGKKAEKVRPSWVVTV